jgi:hypothetical protein
MRVHPHSYPDILRLCGYVPCLGENRFSLCRATLAVPRAPMRVHPHPCPDIPCLGGYVPCLWVDIFSESARAVSHPRSRLA